jgi:hypothetical protein
MSRRLDMNYRAPGGTNSYGVRRPSRGADVILDAFDRMVEEDEREREAEAERQERRDQARMRELFG